MLFNSPEFFLFLILVFAGYWLCNYIKPNTLAHQVQNAFIFVASYFFYAWWDWRFLFLISFSALQGFVFAWWMDSSVNERKRKILLTIAVLINLLFLGAFKYFNFFSESLEALLKYVGMNADFITLDWILPIGISFYTFHNISYLVDVYRRDIPATKDPVVYFSFMSYFPQLVAGPIQRGKDLIPQFQKERTFDYTRAVAGLQQVLWGLFKKVVMADNCALFADHAFANYQSLSGFELIMGVFFFSFQIYGDFSGYTDIALGVSRLFGIELTTNFKTPYFAASIAEFWRRWHISLTTWFKDYVYIPLGGSKKGLAITIRNTMIIFLISGIWHGAKWTFVIWGALNAIYFLPSLFRKKATATQDNTHLAPAHILMVFLLISFAWIFFRATSVEEAWGYIQQIGLNVFLPQEWKYILPAGVTIVLLFVLVVEWIYFRKDGFTPVHFRSSYISWPIYAALAFLILMNISFHGSSEFIYFQF